MNCLKQTFAAFFVIILVFCSVFANGEIYAWNCPDCGRTGNTGNYCGNCSHPAPWIINVGDYVTFGHYPQTMSGDDNSLIEWLVLDIQDNRILLISRYGLDCQPYNKTKTAVVWEDCTLYTWLNKTFMKKAFTDMEQSGILTNTANNSKSQEKVFLLCYEEVLQYFSKEKSRMSIRWKRRSTHGAVPH